MLRFEHHHRLLTVAIIGFSAVLSACAVTIHDYDHDHGHNSNSYHNPGHPPPLKHETMGVAPYPEAHWIHGEWVWRHDQWEWVPGHWAHIHH